ncbi:MAG: rRNA pseudouridine synthase [Planctomycetia bacterium]|nr:rRNA pseudouridine synthase [Planctomycetia bacterium]
MTETDSDSEATGGEGIRLQRYLAMAGAGSRRHCEEFILAGRVTVGRETIRELGYRVVPGAQEVRLDGERVRLERKVWYLLNKPIGFLCTNSDPAGRARVLDLFPRNRERLFTVGRLDENSQGLLLATNDGDIAHRLAHPRFRVRKVYQVQVAGVPPRELLEQLKRGLYFAEGRFKVADAKFVRAKGSSAIIELVLTEGQNREIRRLMAKLGHKVQRLVRVALGPIELGDLPVGQHRPLAPQEVAALHDLVSGGNRRQKTGRPRPGKSRPRRAK